jgi:carboxyl-terminal processing protease
MLAKNGTVLNKFSASALLLITLLSFAVPAPAADPVASGLKAIAPQLDPEADKKPLKLKPLQAGLQVNEKAEDHRGKALRATAADQGGLLKSGVKNGGFLGKLRSGAKTAQTEQLKSNASAGALNAAATSGVGIIGVKFVLTIGKPPIVNRVFPGTPAFSLGLAPGDAIVAVDGVPTYGLAKEEVYDLIIGSPGTKVNVSIMRSGDFRVYTCTRMDINDLTDPVVRRDYLMSM